MSVDSPTPDTSQKRNHTLWVSGDWLLFLHKGFSRFPHVTARISTSFFYYWIIFRCVGIPTFCLFIYSSVDGHLGCFHFLAVWNNACYENPCTTFCLGVFTSPGFTPRSETAGSCDTFTFNILRNCQTSPKGLHLLMSLQQRTDVLSFRICANPCNCSCLFICLIVTILGGVKWYLPGVCVFI